MATKLFTKVFLITLLSSIGIYLFTDGLILHQEKDVKHYSACDQWSPNKNDQKYTFLDEKLQKSLFESPMNGKFGPCVSEERRVGKVVFVLLDAIRYDFVVSDPNPNKDNQFYKNHLRVFENIAKIYPERAMMYRFSQNLVKNLIANSHFKFSRKLN